MSFRVYFWYDKDGALHQWSGANYKVYAASGTAVKGETAMTHLANGIFYAALDPTGWSAHDDGEYLVHMYVDGKEIKKYQMLWVKVVNDQIESLSFVDILTVLGTPTASVSDDISGVKADTEDVLSAAATLASILGSPVGASVSADIAAVKSQGDDIEADTQDIQASLADGTSGLAAIKGQANKIDSASTTVPSSATTGSLLDRLANKDGSKTYSQATDALEAIRDRGDSSWGGAASTAYRLVTAVNAAGATKKFTALILKNGQVMTSGVSNLNVTIKKRVPGGSSVTQQTISVASPDADGVFDETLSFTPAQGEVYSITGTVTADSSSRDVADICLAL